MHRCVRFNMDNGKLPALLEKKLVNGLLCILKNRTPFLTVVYDQQTIIHL